MLSGPQGCSRFVVDPDICFCEAMSQASKCWLMMNACTSSNECRKQPAGEHVGISDFFMARLAPKSAMVQGTDCRANHPTWAWHMIEAVHGSSFELVWELLDL